MDISKLPKLSNTPAASDHPAAPADDATDARSPAIPPPRPARAAVRESPSIGTGAEAWVSIVVGIILLLMTPNTLGYFSSKIFHTTFAPFADPTRPPPARCDFILFTDGTKIFYRDSDFFWSDLVVTAFAIVLILDGILMVRARRATTVLAVFCLTVAATAANLLYLLTTFSTRGLPIWSALGVIFGGYIAMYQWNAYKLLRDHEAVR